MGRDGLLKIGVHTRAAKCMLARCCDGGARVGQLSQTNGTTRFVGGVCCRVCCRVLEEPIGFL